MRLQHDLIKHISSSNYSLFWPITLLILLVSALSAIWFESLMPLALPLILLFALWVITDFTVLIPLIIVLIPLSIEMELPGGLGLDVPDEPLMIITMFLFIIWAAFRFRALDWRFIKHPISLLLFLHFLWIGIAAIHAGDQLIAFKFFLAKSWYIVVFYLAAFYWISGAADFFKIMRLLLLVLVPVVLLIMGRHGIEQGFSFEGINYVVGPFFRNHVAYAALMVVSFPFIFYLAKYQKLHNRPYLWIILAMAIILVGTYFSYTRAAYGALLLAIPYYFVIRYRLTKTVLIIALVLGGSLLGWLINENRYLNLAPQYERAITHSSFDDLLDATYKFEDISTMERLYRWVAAFRMIEDKPVFGFGPNNFYGSYKNYTLSKFKTYVSDNPERSGMHNYLLMTTIEQGIPGLIIFLALLFSAFIYAEKIYHKLRHDPAKAWLCLAATFSLIIIVVLQLMNDLIETDKVGPFFFLSLAIIVKLHLDFLDSKRTASDHSPKA